MIRHYQGMAQYAHSTYAGTSPSLNLIAAEDGTEITLLPKVAVQGGGGVMASPANTPMKKKLNAVQNVQITQEEDLTGSPIESNKPIGLMASHKCMTVPTHVAYCDHAEQQIPPVRALGNEYACVTYRPRAVGLEVSPPAQPENPPWRIIGAVADTTLTFDPASVHSTATIGLGWGTPETGNPVEGGIFTENVSYGYPAGENVRAINEVYVPPVPK